MPLLSKEIERPQRAVQPIQIHQQLVDGVARASLNVELSEVDAFTKPHREQRVRFKGTRSSRRRRNVSHNIAHSIAQRNPCTFSLSHTGFFRKSPFRLPFSCPREFVLSALAWLLLMYFFVCPCILFLFVRHAMLAFFCPPLFFLSSLQFVCPGVAHGGDHG